MFRKLFKAAQWLVLTEQATYFLGGVDQEDGVAKLNDCSL